MCLNMSEPYQVSARIVKSLAALYLALLGLALVLVHGDAYAPGVSFVILYLVSSVLLAGSLALLVLAAEQFSDLFCVAAYTVYAALWSLAVFFTGAASSELYVLYFPLLLALALDGGIPQRARLIVLGAVLVCYTLAVLPDLLNGIAGDGKPGTVLFRLSVLALPGVFGIFARTSEPGPAEPEEPVSGGEPEPRESTRLLEVASGEISARPQTPVGLVLVDPGSGVKDTKALLKRVRTRIGEPVPVGDENVFGVVLSGVDERRTEGAARRALAAASSQGAREFGAGAAVYPQDARSAEDLLDAAERALEAARKKDAPSAVVLSGRNVTGRGRAAR